MMNLYEMKEYVQLVWEKVERWWASLRVAVANDKKGWLICLAVLIITVVRSSITYSFGVFVVKLENLWKSSLAEQSQYTMNTCFTI